MAKEKALMKRTLFAGALALGIAALANPAFAQGQGSMKSDSSAENPSTKTGGDTKKKDDAMTKSQGSATTGSAPRGTMSNSPTGAGTPGKAMDDKKKDINSSSGGGAGGGGAGGGGR
jgi:hypothetical protein